MTLFRLWLQNLKTSAAAFEGVPLAWPWYLPRPHKLFLLGFETAMWHVLGRPQKTQNLRSSFRRPYNLTNPPQQLSKACCLLGHGTSLGHTSCFYCASKLLCGTFWAGLKSLKTSAAAFEGLITSQPSAGAFEGVPLAWPWYLPRPHKLFLLGFETAMWHVLGRPQKPQNLRSSFRRPYNLTTPPQQLSKACCLLGHGTSLGPTSCFYCASKLLCGTFWAGLKSLKTSAAAFESLITSQPSAAAFEGVPVPPWAPQAVSLGLRNCYVARFGQALKASKTSASSFRKP